MLEDVVVNGWVVGVRLAEDEIVGSVLLIKSMQIVIII